MSGAEDDALDEAAGRGAFGEVAECGRDAPAQDDEQDEESVERADENVAIVGVGIGLGAGVFGGRGRVFDDGSTCGYRGCCDDAGELESEAGLDCACRVARVAAKSRNSARTAIRFVIAGSSGHFGSVSAESLDHRVHGGARGNPGT